jgi:alpha-glucosidase
VLPMIRDAIRFRYRLMPYLYSLYRRAATHGEPMLRPTFFDFDSDPRTFDDTDDFMLGPSLLVACVVEPGARRRRVYLPKGPAQWFDFWTGRAYASGRDVVVAAPLGRVPLFVPAGGMIPLTDTGAYDALHDEPSRQLRVFAPRGEGASSFSLYEDDGVSRAHAAGAFAEVTFEFRASARTIDMRARKSGDYPLARPIRIVPRPGDRRRLTLRGDGVTLVA